MSLRDPKPHCDTLVRMRVYGVEVTEGSWSRSISHESVRLIQWLFLSFVLFLSWRRQWHPTPVLLPEKSHGWRNLVGCSPWGLQESDTTERLHFHFSLSCIGEGNGNPLQCSCLENPRDGRAWWAAMSGVAQSRTRLKQQQQHDVCNSLFVWLAIVTAMDMFRIINLCNSQI